MPSPQFRYTDAPCYCWNMRKAGASSPTPWESGALPSKKLVRPSNSTRLKMFGPSCTGIFSRPDVCQFMAQQRGGTVFVLSTSFADRQLVPIHRSALPSRRPPLCLVHHASSPPQRVLSTVTIGHVGPSSAAVRPSGDPRGPPCEKMAAGTSSNLIPNAVAAWRLVKKQDQHKGEMSRAAVLARL